MEHKQKNGTVIVKCNCEHEYQDKEYGKKSRVANLKQGFKATCTVCGKEHNADKK